MRKNQIVELKEFMVSQGYEQRTIQQYISSIKWFPNIQPNIEKGALFKHIKKNLLELQQSCYKSEYNNLHAALGLYFKMLTGTCIKSYERSLSKPGRFELVLDSFYEYSINIKKLFSATAQSERNHVKQFLECIFSNATEVSFQDITAFEIRDYVCTKISPLADSSKGRYITSIRNFFRYLEYTGISIHPSIFKLPLSPFAWKNRSFPSTLTEDEVLSLLEYFSGNTAKETRNRTIFLIFLDLGLRCAEVPFLKLHDICWNRGEIVIRKTKNRRARVLPLSNRLGMALEDYVLYHRGNSSDDHLFQKIGKRYEGQPMNTEGVRRIIRAAFQKSHIEGWWKGTHAIRRTAASKIFNSGNSLKLTADILGHDSIQSTTAYIKIDTNSLCSLAGDWPTGGASC